MWRAMSNGRGFLALLVVVSAVSCVCEGFKKEGFSEEVLLRPLPDGKVLAHLFFTIDTPPASSYGHHHTIFPKAISQLVQKFRIREMELSFTQGRWNYHRWGSLDLVSSSSAKPKGVDLWAIFGVPEQDVDRTWRELTHALSGMFSSSINFLESTERYAAPGPAFRPDLLHVRSAACSTGAEMQPRKEAAAGKVGDLMRYGALPREAACTENLTPWLKLLPCRDKAGLATLLDRASIYRGFYHSLKVHVKSGDFGAVDGLPVGTRLELSLTLVLWPSAVDVNMTRLRRDLLPSWSLQSVFGSGIIGSCPLASFSRVYLELEASLLDVLKGVAPTEEQRSQQDDAFSETGEKHVKDWSVIHGAVSLYAEPEDLLEGSEGSLLLAYGLSRASEQQPLNVGLAWKVPVSWSVHRGPFRATRFVTGSGNQKGAIVTKLMANQSPTGGGDRPRNLVATGVQKNLQKSDMVEHQEIARGRVIDIFQVFPWYIHLYGHTLKVFVDGVEAPLWSLVKWLRLSPLEFRKHPTVLEMELELPSNASVVGISFDFDKGFLRIDEHPPDANHGFDIPSALITFPHLRTSHAYVNGSGPLLRDMQVGLPVQMYSENLLIPLATPDFSMPYNVITLTCTVLALYFGSVLNALRRRLGEEERAGEVQTGGKLRKWLSKYFPQSPGSNSGKFSKLLKIFLVVGVGIIVHYFINL